MDMIRHDFYSIDSLAIVLKNILKDSYEVLVGNKNRIAIFGTPHEMIIDIANRMVISIVIRQNNTQY